MTLDPRITGHTDYSQDQHMEGMLHARILRSPHPHAKVLSINTAAAGGNAALLAGDESPR